MVDMKKLIMILEGTCMSLNDGLGMIGCCYDDLSLEDLYELDDALFECDGCGWWYPVPCEDEGLCEQCYKEKEEN